MQIRTNVAIYVDLDLALARAAVAERMNAVEPAIVDDATIDVHDGRHPLLDDAPCRSRSRSTTTCA